jgi:peroxiredoxin
LPPRQVASTLAGMKLHLLLVALCGALGAAAHAASTPTPATLVLGSSAPDFSLPGVDGRMWSLKDFADARVLVVVFTCNHCPTAQYYEERIKRLVTDYQGRGVALVAISPNDPKSVRLDELGWADLSDSLPEMKLRAQERAFNFPYLYDGDTQAASRAYGPVATPHVFLFDAGRKLRYAGALDDSERVAKVTKHHLRDALNAVLAGREPAVAQTKVVGCSVKWAGKEAGVRDYLAKLAAEPVSVTKADAATLRTLRAGNPQKLRLVSFWATWCAPCVAEFDEFVTINRMYRHRDFEMVLVAVNRPEEEPAVLEFLKKHEASNRNLLFASADREPLINAFNPDWAGPVPYTVLLSPEGRVLYENLGSIEPLPLKRAILKALNERKPW